MNITVIKYIYSILCIKFVMPPYTNVFSSRTFQAHTVQYIAQ